MKSYFVTWHHNYGTSSCIIIAKDLVDCHNIYKSSETIWKDYEVEEFDVTKLKRGKHLF